MKILVKKFRESKGWSQTTLARMSGVSQTYISELEAGKSVPTVSILKNLADALDVSIIQLLEDDKSEIIANTG
ncbi:MAG: helix-turn-helix domain protein [Clostridiales bacterium]|jgi:transcriptional regulator with XRE-family HTH domain|nr:helix-turn-helix domain protein [Clostridiales bacterium]